MMKFNEKYKHEDFVDFLSNFLPEDFTQKEEDIVIKKERYKEITKAQILGFSKSLELHVLEMNHARENDPRIAIATDAFKILADHWIHRALIIFKNKDSDNYRFSYLTISLDLNEKNKAVKKYSNARRYSYYLGPNAKINTPTKFLINKGRVVDFDDLKTRFSLEVVNKEFYKQISESFIKLVGGTFGSGKNKKLFKAALKLPSVPDQSQASLEFAVRLIGRVIFCWFLREKKSPTGTSLMPKELLSFEAVSIHPDYYHKILEPIFFEILNKEVKSREELFSKGAFSLIPYLNGGLFSPHGVDYYKRRNEEQSLYHNTLVIPDEWFTDFFKTLETYNFTIDENTSYDEELSIDPEMLGRIFENLLAEINPETGESARKSTGSYYTPRAIVNYMVDESLLLYLKQQTNIAERKLRAIISYDLVDDSQFPLDQSEKQNVTDSLEKLKLLDPACGSGAFPIGALQKIVFILQQIDQDGHLWFKTQIKKASPEIRRIIEREFSHKNFDYIRKLGVIRENIYGVDIQPIATEISRLRCFLTLVVDERVDDSLSNRGIEPLPNLDFKFVTANSLIGLPSNKQKSLFNDQTGIDQLKDLRDQFFNATNSERFQLKDEFKEIQKKMLLRMIETRGGDDITQKLSAWDPFSNNASSWFDPGWMFGIEDGFDIVIANPPWGSDIQKDEKKELKKLYPPIDSSTPNSFAYFIGLGWNLTKSNLSYVLPDSILIKDFAKTRELLTPFITEIAWYQNTGLPEKSKPFTYVEHDVCVIFATKIRVPRLTTVVNKYSTATNSVTTNIKVVSKESVILQEFGYAFNLMMNDNDLRLLAKLLPLDPINKYLQCHEGIHTGNIREKLFFHTEINGNCKPLYYGAGTGGDKINNYFSSRSGWYVDYRKEIIDNNNGDYASLRDEKIFKYPKIYVTRTGNPFKAFIDEDSYASNNFFSLQLKDYESNNLEKLKIFIPFVTSRVTQYFIRKFAAPRLGNTFVETKIIHLLKVRIPKLSDSQGQQLVELVDNIYLAVKNSKEEKLKEYEKQIDQLVYKLYDLTPEDVKIIELSTK